MNVLVATREMQGKRKNDFCHVPEGEIVRFQFECDGEAVDGRCGCRRSMAGTLTSRSTTTMKVVDMDLTPEQFQSRIESSLRRDGWISDEMPDWKAWIREEAMELLAMAAAFPAGEVVEKRGVYFRARANPPPEGAPERSAQTVPIPAS